MDEDGFGNMGENMKSLLMDQEASARSDAGIIVMSMFFAGILIVAFTTNPIASGTKIGERAPIFRGDAYDGSSWSTFEFEDLLDSSWTWNSTEDAPWIAVEFLDTDCGYCKQSAPDVGEWAQMYSAEQWPGPDVIFIAVAVEFVADSSITEVEEFRAQYNNNFLYVDDLDNDIAGDWDVSATPTYFLVQPDGIVAWNSGQATNSLGWDAKEEQSTSLNHERVCSSIHTRSCYSIRRRFAHSARRKRFKNTSFPLPVNYDKARSVACRYDVRMFWWVYSLRTHALDAQQAVRRSKCLLERFHPQLRWIDRQRCLQHRSVPRPTLGTHRNGRIHPSFVARHNRRKGTNVASKPSFHKSRTWCNRGRSSCHWFASKLRN